MKESELYRLTPAYDLLNTRFHITNESTDTALDLFKDDFQTPSHTANAFYAYDDFLKSAPKKLYLESVRDRIKRLTYSFENLQS